MTPSSRRFARCTADALYQATTTGNGGVPEQDDRVLFEMLVLEGAQAGLSWLTVLKERDDYRRAFPRFEM